MGMATFCANNDQHSSWKCSCGRQMLPENHGSSTVPRDKLSDYGHNMILSTVFAQLTLRKKCY